MDRKNQDANNANIVKDYLSIIIIAAIGIIITVAVFIRVFTISRQSIINTWSAKTMIMSQEIEVYLNLPKDAVLFAAQGVEDMQDAGATNAEINDFLKDATTVFAEIIEGNNTGIYGYVNGEYLDSSGWIPPEGFNPLERPWYIDAVKADGEITFVEPYLNVQTGTLMMSVSKLLKDKKSVLSMDFYLNTIQRMSEEMLTNDELEMSMVIDSDGLIVAHSDPNEIGKDYSDDDISFHEAIMNGISEDDRNNFSFFNDGRKKIAFSKRINNEWFAVYIFDEKVLFSSIIYVYVNSFFVLAVVFAAFLIALRIFRKRHVEAKQLQNELAAIADIYLSLSILDLKELKLNRMWVSQRLTDILNAGNYSLTRVDEIVQGIAAESSRTMLAQFMDFSTVAERLENTKSISHDFLDIDNKWTRMHFIAGYRENDGTLRNVIWATESIDEDKRRQEELRQKAETDGLTKILNRRGGETKLYEAFENGVNGMFMILDADHFKKVNDTYGHDTGDQVIITLANCLTETFRDSDIVFRLGGDEFAVYAAGVGSVDVGKIVAARLFANINSVEIPGVTDWKLNISVGATFCDTEDNLSFDQYFKQADNAMYSSKQVEGNRVSFYNGEAVV